MYGRFSNIRGVNELDTVGERRAWGAPMGFGRVTLVAHSDGGTGSRYRHSDAQAAATRTRRAVLDPGLYRSRYEQWLPARPIQSRGHLRHPAFRPEHLAAPTRANRRR